MWGRFSSIDITPMHPCVLAGDWFRLRPFVMIHSPLEMNAALFAESDNGMLLISVDSLYAGRELKDHLQKEALAQLGVPASQVLVFASHTHFAPSLDRTKPRLGEISSDYLEMVCERATRLVKALAAQKPRRIAIRSASTITDRAVNRRCYWPYPVLTRSGPKLGSVVLGPSPDGYCENLVHSLWVHGDDETLLATIWNYACHPVCFPGTQIVSSEYPGVVRTAIRQEVGENMPVLFLQGFSGDIRPRAAAARKGALTFLQTLIIGPRFGSFSNEEWKHWSDGIADAVLRGREDAQDTDINGINAKMSTFPVREIFSGTAIPDQIEFHGLSLGPDLRFLTVSAEPVAELGPLVAENTILVGYEGDVFGYLPTDAMISEGGYEGGGFIPLFHLDGYLVRNVDACFALAAHECGMSAHRPT